MQRSVALATGVVIGVFLIKPNGILVLPVQSSPAVLAAYALLALRRVALAPPARGSCSARRAHADRDADAPAPPRGATPRRRRRPPGPDSRVTSSLEVTRGVDRPALRRAPETRTRDRLAIAIPTAVSAVLCLLEISGRSLGFDESATVTIAAQHGSPSARRSRTTAATCRATTCSSIS